MLNNSQSNGEELMNEVETIGRIPPIIVVRLLGFCRLIQKSSHLRIHSKQITREVHILIKEKIITHSLVGKKLQDISINIARGIEYHHQGYDQGILHFDIIPHYIILDHKFNTKISDLGLAKLYSKGDSIVSIMAARGTMGYIAAEVFSENFENVSYKSDVYSFPMLLLEMGGGRKNIEVQVDKASQVYFPEWIYSRLELGEELGIEVKMEEDAKIARKLATAALWCIQWNPVDLPSKKLVIQMLEGNSENLTMPPNRFVSATSAKTTTTPIKPQKQTEITIILEEPECTRINFKFMHT